MQRMLQQQSMINEKTWMMKYDMTLKKNDAEKQQCDSTSYDKNQLNNNVKISKENCAFF